MQRSKKSIEGDLDLILQLSTGSSFPEMQSPVFVNSVVGYQKATAHDNPTVVTDTARLLVLFTGGTIGMKACGDQGYVPVPNWLYDTLSKTTRFNDPEYSLEIGSEDLEEVLISSLYADGDGYSGTREIRQRALITPKTLYGKRIRYSVLEYDPLLDSANMTMSDWIKIAVDVEHNYANFDSFVIVHGTDTMAYTASALSFMLEDLGKTVVITGSQVPLAEWRTDAEQNLLGALLMASHFPIPEVCLFCDNTLFRGNRCTKINALDFRAFDSPNLKPLAQTGVNIHINWNEVRRLEPTGSFHAHKLLNPNVATLRIFPGITSSTVRAFLQPPIQGVVLETYGAGNAPTTRSDLLDILKQACQSGVVIVNCTQCKRGMVSDVYATGKALTALGIVPGGDMTPECALTKLSYLLGKNRSPYEVRKLMQTNLRGELSVLSRTSYLSNK